MVVADGGGLREGDVPFGESSRVWYLRAVRYVSARADVVTKCQVRCGAESLVARVIGLRMRVSVALVCTARVIKLRKS